MQVNDDNKLALIFDQPGKKERGIIKDLKELDYEIATGFDTGFIINFGNKISYLETIDVFLLSSSIDIQSSLSWIKDNISSKISAKTQLRLYHLVPENFDAMLSDMVYTIQKYVTNKLSKIELYNLDEQLIFQNNCTNTNMTQIMSMEKDRGFINFRELYKMFFETFGVEIEFSGRGIHERGVIVDYDNSVMEEIGVESDKIRLGNTVIKMKPNSPYYWDDGFLFDKIFRILHYDELYTSKSLRKKIFTFVKQNLIKRLT